MRRLAFDTESDNFLADATTLHCINVLDRDTGERMRFNDHPEVNPDKRTGSLEEGVRLLNEASELVGHNIINHDIPIIRKFFPWFDPKGKVKDGLVLGRVIWTDLAGMDFRAIRKGKRPKEFKEQGLIGRHSLEAWGYRYGDYKGDYAKVKEAEARERGITDPDDIRAYVWGTFNADMDDYCAQDVEVSARHADKIEAMGYSEESLELETRVSEIIAMQERHGVLFDVEAAEKLHVELLGEAAELEDKLRDAFPPWFTAERKHGKPVIANPKRSMTRKTILEDGTKVPTRYEVGHEYCKVKLVSFEPTSRDMIANRLQTLYGWEPQEFTDGGKPKVDETALSALDFPQAPLLIRYLTISKRLGTLATGKKALMRMVKSDGRIHGKVNPNGARTGRMTHSDPNVNLPKVFKKKLDDGTKVPKLGYEGGYGWEFRSTFIVPPGKKLVGTDADGLELRMLGHYLARYDDGAFAREVVEGDIHTQVQKALGFNDRDYAKRFEYAYLYGAGNWKLGLIIYEDFTDAQRSAFNADYPNSKRDAGLTNLGGSRRKMLETTFPAIGKLQEAVQWVPVKGPNGKVLRDRDGKPRRKRRKTLRSLDGRILQSVSQHSALNTLLQGGGALVMKKALVIAYDEMIARGWEFGREFAFVLNVHDEFQNEVDEDKAEEAAEIAAQAIVRAGEWFNLRVPLAGSSDIGNNWAETH